MNYREAFTMRRLWLMFIVMLAVMFAVLLLVGSRAFQLAPPVPSQVVIEGTDEAVFSNADIHAGRDVWRRLGGMELGSVWGHGSYLAPDWTADVLHREAIALLDHDDAFEDLSEEEQSMRIASLKYRIRENTYDVGSDTIAISAARAAAISELVEYYTALFGGTGDDATFEAQREAYAIPNNPLGANPDESIRQLVAWFWWTSWSAVTERPDDEVSYTNNWPHEPLVGNTPSAATFIWSFVSVVLLIAAVGALCWFFIRERNEWQRDTAIPEGVPEANPIATANPTKSMSAVIKYVWIVGLLLGLQIVLGAITAHYAVEGHDFYGIPLSDIAPYALTRTWHVQLAVFWIATAWLGAGLYLGPIIAGYEPKAQHWGVNFLWLALVGAVLGSLIGEWLTLTGRITDPLLVYWFGHQGYEYLDMGRFWQILIFVGLLVWLALMARCLIPALRQNREDKHLLALLFISSAGIGLLFGAGLLYERDTHLTVAEYWRWWVVHLWVEGVFEVFAQAHGAWVFVKSMVATRLCRSPRLTSFSAWSFWEAVFWGRSTTCILLARKSQC